MFVGVALLVLSVGHAQTNIKVTTEIVDMKRESEQKTVSVKDSLRAERHISQQLYQLYFQGYLAAAVVERQWVGGNLNVTIYKGELYHLRSLSPGNLDPLMLTTIGFKDKKNSNVPFRVQEVERLFRRILNQAENSGYPFASVKLDSLAIEGSDISASIHLWQGPRILFDTLIVRGDVAIKPGWLARFLDIRFQAPYSEKSVSAIREKLKNLHFLELTDDPQVVFSKSRAKVILDLRERKINNVDGVIGVLPNASQQSKLLLIGNLNLHLYNLFSSAKQLHLDWQKVKENSQAFDFSFAYPQFLKMPLGINGGLNLLKEDTVFFNRNLNLRISFIPAARQNIYVSTEFETSRLTGIAGETSRSSLEFNDYRINYYGLAYEYNKLDRLFAPTRGWIFSVDGLAGQKNVIVNTAWEEALYEGLELKTTQYKLRSRFEVFLPVYKSYTTRLRLLSGNVIGKTLFANDLFRIGGLKTLRGFNENFFFASNYLLANTELRVRSGEETFFFLFYDQAVIRTTTVADENTDYPFGTGLGMSLATNTGIFNFIFAFGKSQTQNFSINSAKIHFGYTGRF